MKEKGNKKAVGGEKQNKRLKAWKRRSEWVRQGQRGESEQTLLELFFLCLQHFLFGENSNLQVRKLSLILFWKTFAAEVFFSKECIFLWKSDTFWKLRMSPLEMCLQYCEYEVYVCTILFWILKYFSSFSFPSQFHSVILNSVFRHVSYKQSTVINFHVLGLEVYFYLIIERFYSQKSRHSLYKYELWIWTLQSTLPK